MSGFRDCLYMPVLRPGRTLALFAAMLVAQLSCSDSNEPPIVAAVTSISVAPAMAAAAPNTFVVFTAQSPDGMSEAVSWRVNGIAGGTAAIGLIAANGRYSAPATIPAGDSVVVSAVLTADTTRRSSSTIFFVPDLNAKNYYVAIPRVVDATRPLPTRFLLVPPAGVASIVYLPRGGAAVPLVAIGSGVFTFEVNAAAALAGYQTGTLHNLVGNLDYRTPDGARFEITNLSMNVREATMPDVTITPIAADAQRTAYVLNLRLDSVTVNASPAVVARALQLLGGDRFDVVDVIATVTTNNNRNYLGLRNDIGGIGARLFDASRSAGGTGRLRGMISFPIDAFFDGAEQGFIHETGHSWINYATDRVLGPGAPHWPPSTMALGAMGWSIPGSGAGGSFPFSLTPIGNDSVRINRATPSDHFAPLDLYLMGLLPPDSVPPMYVLPTTADPNTFVDGMTSPATTYTIADYIAGQGVRVPATAARRAVDAAVVVLTYGRLLTPSEIAFFDAAAARAETRVPLRSTTGFITVTASGFFLATGGRATMQTRLP